MKQSILYIIFIVFVLGGGWSCAQAPREPQNPSEERDRVIFNDPENEKKVGELKVKLAADPNDLETRIELGTIFLQEEMIKEAITEFEGVLKSEPQHIQAHLLLALARQKDPNLDLSKTLALLEEAVEIAPNHADAHLNLAQVYDQLEEEDKAIREFNQALELSELPDDAMTLLSAHLGLMAIYTKRAQNYRNQNELEKAKKELGKAHYELEEASEIYPDIEEVLIQLDIADLTPPPEYAGDSSVHPELEKRKKETEKLIEELGGKPNE